MRPFVVALGLLLAAVVAVDLAAIWKRRQLEPRERMLLYHNADERLFHKARLDLVGRPRVVLFGSSRVTKLSAGALGLPRAAFYNAGMGAASVEDFIGVWTLLRDQGKTPEVAVFAIESWQLDANQPPARWRSLQEEVARFLDVRALGAAARWSLVSDAAYRWDGLTEFVSFTVFRSSVRDLRKSRVLAPTETALTKALEREEHYGELITLRDEAFRRRVVEIAYAGGGVTVAYRWDTRRAELLQTLWRDMAGRGIRIVAYMPPYHPAAWAVVGTDPRHARARQATDRFLRDSTPRPLARVANFSDPASVPCAESDFFDSSHQNAECLSRIFRKVVDGIVR